MNSPHEETLFPVGTLACPVCEKQGSSFFLQVSMREYWRCATCESTFLTPVHWLSRQDEMALYQKHRNDPDDEGYRRFLARLAQPLLERLPSGASGLDYGCGPGHVLAAMLSEEGHAMAVFDPFFANDPRALTTTYDFITCTEVAEHFHRPAEEFRRLQCLLKPGGWLAVMTCFQTEDARFADWHYRRDPTHVVFYREATFAYLARCWGWYCEVPCRNVVLLQRP